MVSLCRLCAEQRRDTILTEIEDDNSEFCQQVRRICQLDIRLSDPLPKLVCGECVWTIQTFSLFHTKVWESQECLETILLEGQFNCTTAEVMENQEEILEKDMESDENQKESLHLRNSSQDDANIDESFASGSPLQKSFSQDLSASVRKKGEEWIEILNINAEENDEHVTPDPLDFHTAKTCNANSITICKSDAIGTFPKTVKRLTHQSVVKEQSTVLRTKVRHAAITNRKTTNKKQVLKSTQKRQTRSLSRTKVKTKIILKPKSKQNTSKNTKNQAVVHTERFSNKSDTKKRPHKCKICNKTFTNPKALRRHMRSHGERLYKCTICVRAFVDQNTLTSHMRWHNGDRPHKCSICDRAFTLQRNLKAHEKRHTFERPFECSICECAFSQKVTLIRHIRRHTGERPYKCSICECAFTQQGTLKNHMKRHAGERS